MKKTIQKAGLIFFIIMGISCTNNDDSDSVLLPILTIADLSISTEENPEVNTVIGVFTLTQENLSNPITFELIEASVPGALSINSNGELLIANSSLFDFETNSSITGVVRVASGNLSDTATFNVEITDVNEIISFITGWNVTSDNLTIRLPIYEESIDDVTAYNFMVDWGDGTIGEVTSFDDPDAMHTYAAPGSQTIIITGIIIKVKFCRCITVGKRRIRQCRSPFF